jgi:acyl-CoA dehydrogenase
MLIRNSRSSLVLFLLDNLAKRIMPKISKTEEAALQAGTVGFDGELFNGNPSLANLVKKYDVSLRDDETAYMNNQVEKLCALLDDYEVTRDRDMPENVWEYLKREKVNTFIC